MARLKPNVRFSWANQGDFNRGVFTTLEILQSQIDSISGGSVDSVNGQTGVVVLDTGDISEVTDKNYVTDSDLINLANLPSSGLTQQQIEALISFKMS